MQAMAERVRRQADEARRTADAQRRQLEADLRAANRRSSSGVVAPPVHTTAADLWRSRSQQLLAAPSLDERPRQPAGHVQPAGHAGEMRNGSSKAAPRRETGTTDSSIIEVGYRRSASYHGGGKGGEAPLSSYQKRLAEIRAKR